ncbi:MAG TPA: Gfo/Idh/MocA family oxidoreductase [Lachnospiraceae bacterium]|nr:Gfo/Idh/MocA family oxidoreductase [Lachnospiraceae bacterium]
MKKIHMAILGSGNIAQTMATTMKRMKNVQCYGVASRDLEKAKVFASEYGFKKAYGSYEELVNDPKVELIYVATPHSHHFEHAKLCISHGKPVICEKAFTANAKQAEELIAYAEEKGVFITEAMWIRYMPMVASIKGMIGSGIIGDPVYLTCNLGYMIEHVQRLQDPALAGGALLDVGVYTLNFASIIFGDKIKKVTSSCTYTESGMDASNAISIVYDDGKIANIGSTMRGISDRKGIIYGTNGYVIVENINNFDSVKAYNAENKEIAYIKKPKQITGFEYEVQACIDALEKGQIECPQMPHKEIIRIMQMMDSLRHEWGIQFPFEQ